jgi:hypothetical protein
VGVTPAPLFGLTVTVKDVLITWGPLPTVTWTVELVKAGPLPVASIVMGALMALLVAWTQPVSALLSGFWSEGDYYLAGIPGRDGAARYARGAPIGAREVRDRHRVEDE